MVDSSVSGGAVVVTARSKHSVYSRQFIKRNVSFVATNVSLQQFLLQMNQFFDSFCQLCNSRKIYDCKILIK